MVKFRWYALKLTLLVIIIYILQIFFSSITDNLVLISSDVYERPWILVTAIFLHGSLLHLLYNSFALALFGSILEKKIGSYNFLLIFFLTGIISSLAAALFYDSALGASGAIFGIIGMLAAISPLLIVPAFGAPMPVLMAAILWALVDFIGLTGQSGGIANAAHLAGLFSGLVIGFLFFRKSHKRQSEILEWKKNY